LSKEFNIDETDLTIGPLEKATACYQAGRSAKSAGEIAAAEKLFFRAIQLYDMAERPDMVLECAHELGQAEPKKSADLYAQAIQFFIDQGDDRTASDIIKESGLPELILRFEEHYLVE